MSMDPKSSVSESIAELTALRAAIALGFSAGAQVSSEDLLELYVRERIVIGRLRRRLRQWRAETRLSEVAESQTEAVPVRASP